MNKPKGASMAIHVVLTKEEAQVIFQDADATVITKKDEQKYKIRHKRIFTWEHPEAGQYTFIVCDVYKQK